MYLVKELLAVRPVSLRFKGIGSYFGENSIDFSSLDSVFLICGETGSGKTTILDAITLALYDESSGGDRTELLNSHYQKNNGTAYSIFTFELNGRLYRFSREYSPKARAAGFESSRSCEYYENDVWHSFFANPTRQKVTGKAVELLGLTAAQFRQSVILPQGKFERLLISSSEEKESILKTLFEAQKYTAITDKLKEQAGDEKQRLASQRQALAMLLAAEGFSDIADALREAERIAAELDPMRREYDKAQEERTAADNAERQGQLLLKLFEQLDAAQAELDKLLAKKPQNDAMRLTAERLAKEAAALAEYNAYIAAETEKKRRENAFKMAEKIYLAAEKRLGEAVGEYKAQQSGAEKNDSLRAEALRLKGLREVYENAKEPSERVKLLAGAEERLKRQESIILADISRIKAQTEKIAAEAEDIRRKYPAGIGAVYERLRRLSELKEAADKLDSAAADAEDILQRLYRENALLKAADAKEKNAFERYSALRKDFLESVSKSLADSLKEGEPCPVCGSVHHPKRADAEPACTVTQEALDAAANAHSDKLRIKNELIARTAALRQELDAANDRTAKAKAVLEGTGYSREAYAAAAAEYERAVSEIAREDNIRSEAAKLSKERDALEERLKAVSESLAKARGELMRANAEYEAAKKSMDSAYPNAQALFERIRQLMSEVEAFDKRTDELLSKRLECERAFSAADQAYSTARDELEKAKNACLCARETLEERLRENSLPPADEFSPDIEGIRRLDDIRMAAEDFERELKSAHSRLDDAVRSVGESSRPNEKQLFEAARAAEEKCRSFEYNIRSAEERQKKLLRLIDDCTEQGERLAAEEQICLRRMEFAEEMNGSKGISFTRYVLGVMLELVMEEANAILAGMLGGTFRLVRRREYKANKKQGLDIMVENTLSGVAASYDAAQLSGGEKFMISLAMGIALSTVVQSRTGGISIDAMFIDEGFGSLDPGALKDVMSMIFGLRGARRTIGIISHVEKLKEEIPCRINVIKDSSGSRLSV